MTDTTLTLTWTLHLKEPLTEEGKDIVIGNIHQHVLDEADACIPGFAKIEDVTAPADWGNGWPHVWLGITGEDQAHFDRRWPILAAVPAAVPGATARICIVCRALFDDLTGPGAVLTAEPIDGDAAGAIALVCERCWNGEFDERLRAAVYREFGTRPGELQPLHPGGTA